MGEVWQEVGLKVTGILRRVDPRRSWGCLPRGCPIIRLNRTTRARYHRSPRKKRAGLKWDQPSLLLFVTRSRKCVLIPRNLHLS